MDSLNRETPAGLTLPPVLKKTQSRFICDAERQRSFLGKLYKCAICKEITEEMNEKKNKD